MLVNFYTKQNKEDTTKTFIALVFIRDGRIIFSETKEYKIQAINNGKYWADIRALDRLFDIIASLSHKKEIMDSEKIILGLDSKVILGWFKNSRAVEPYQESFDALRRKMALCKNEIELVSSCLNRAKGDATKEHIKAEKYISALDLFTM